MQLCNITSNAIPPLRSFSDAASTYNHYIPAIFLVFPWESQLRPLVFTVTSFARKRDTCFRQFIVVHIPSYTCCNEPNGSAVSNKRYLIGACWHWKFDWLLFGEIHICIRTVFMCVIVRNMYVASSVSIIFTRFEYVKLTRVEIKSFPRPTW